MLSRMGTWSHKGDSATSQTNGSGGWLFQDSTRGQTEGKGTGDALKYLMNKYRNERVNR